MTNRYVVDLTGVKLSNDASKMIQSRIQASVLDVLAGISQPGELHIRFPREWLGFILSQEIGKLGDLDKKIDKQLQF